MAKTQVLNGVRDNASVRELVRMNVRQKYLHVEKCLPHSDIPTEIALSSSSRFA